MPVKRILSEEYLELSPFVQFDKWYKEHLTYDIAIPDSVTLATSSPDGRVSSRIILLKDHSESGFVFFTNYYSRKGVQLSSNAMASLLFYWPELGRQVRIEGVTEKLSEEDSEKYFRTRPRESQIAAWASEQSSVIPSRLHLEFQYDLYKNQFEDKPVERPSHWGGYRLIPDWFEFWHDGQSRLHDRITYTKSDITWKIERLAP
jgi:pyridoxamine 5'-phosphate oxidase